MPISIYDLDKKLWKELKKNAGVKKSKWFQKADAAVGKHIEAVVKARDKFESGGYLVSDLLKYQSAIEQLEKVFDKFVDSKGLAEIDDGDLKKEEKKKLVAEITNWKNELDKILVGLDKGISTLLKAVNNDVDKLDKAEKGKRKEVLDKTLGEFIL